MPEFHQLITRLQAFVLLKEAGEPLALDELARRIEQRGGQLPFGLQSLRKALSRGPYRRTLSGLIELDPDHFDYWYDEARVEKKREQPPPVAATPAPPPDLKLDEPLTADELQLFTPPAQFGLRRKLICSLDAYGCFSLADPPGPLLSAALDRVDVQRSLAARNLPLRLEEERLVLDVHHPDLAKIRAQVRQNVAGKLALQAEQQARAARHDEWLRQKAETRKATQAHFAALRRGLVQLFFHQGQVAGSLLHLGDLTLQDYSPERLVELRKDITALDILVGLQPATLCERLGVVSKARLVDLTPPFKSRKINKSGRVIHFDDLAANLKMTLSISQPLGEPKKLVEYWHTGQWGKFFRRLHSDLKALYQYYRYGVEHSYVRLRWGFLDETVPCSWNLGDEPGVYEVLREAEQNGGSVELVVGSTPGFEERFSRAVEFWPLGFGAGTVYGRFAHDCDETRIPLPDITAIRPGRAQ